MDVEWGEWIKQFIMYLGGVGVGYLIGRNSKS